VTLDQIASIAEIVGAVGIIITLIYLAIQIKGSVRASKSAAVTDATEAMKSLYHNLASNQQASNLWYRAMRDPDALSDEDTFQFIMMCQDAFLAFQRCFFLSREGTLEHGIRDAMGTAIVAVKDMPGFNLYWQQRRAFFQPEFIDWVEQMRRREPLSHNIYSPDN
jgi:uncharacterized membrane protein YeiB